MMHQMVVDGSEHATSSVRGQDANPLGGPFDVVVVGGGIVGLATARELLRKDPSVRSLLLVEKESTLAAHQTGHNSGVIHSGLYYQPGSAKARTCVRGAEQMLAFCRAHDIAHEICGKVVVAVEPDELPRLEELERRGLENGVDLERIGPERLREIEPHAAGIAALHVPAAAIVDYRAVSAALAGDVRAAGGHIETGVEADRVDADAGIVYLRDGRTIRCGRFVACAGLQADRFASRSRPPGGTPPPRILPFRGDYCELVSERTHLVRGLIYPVPDPRFPFLGVHFTRLVGGGVEAGPNAVLALHRERYARLGFAWRDAWSTLSYSGFWRLALRHWRTGAGEMWRAFRHAAFAQALRRLVPELRDEDLIRAGCGIRAQAILPDGSLVDDFSLVADGDVGLHVCNAPSPAATASLAIAEEIATRSGERAARIAREL